MLRLCIRGARDVPCNAACSVPPPLPHPGAVHRWALVPACCLLHGCITGDVPLLSSGEANFKYHKHNSTLKGPLPASTSAPREGAAGGSGQLARGTPMWGRAPLSGDPHSLTPHLLLPAHHSPHLLTYSQVASNNYLSLTYLLILITYLPTRRWRATTT